MIGLALAAVGWQRYLIYGALAVSIVSGLVGYGYYLGVQKLWDYQVEQARAAVPVIVKQGEVTERVVTVYRDRVIRLKAETVTLTREVAVYVPPSRDPVLALGWVRLHDSAADRSVPAATAGADETTGGIASSQALEGVIGNYGTCHGTSAKLVALQDWVRHQYQAMNQEPLGY